MSKATYIRCPNPKCNKMNPIQLEDVQKEKEYTCIFCGYIMTSGEVNKSYEGSSIKKKEQNKHFSLQQSKKKPINRNMNKPRFE
ncbi:hypothetical protein FJY84_06295 [Candidatus Bathyarchaeota archaeon]|nr:hypothetical protein [Candidatus Bathyarchaeota archaeon]